MPTVAEIAALAFDGVAAGIPDAVHVATIGAATGRVVFDTKPPASEFTDFTPSGSVETVILEGFTTAPSDGDTLTVNSVDYRVVRVTDIVEAGTTFYATVIRDTHFLTQSITIDRVALTSDGVGGYTEAWTPTAATACILGVGGAEAWNADRVAGQNTYRCIVPFTGDGNGAPYWTTADRVVWRGRTYAIDSVHDMGGRSNWLELALIEGKKS